VPSVCIDCARPTPTPAADCPGDCNGDNQVSPEEYQLCSPLIPIPSLPTAPSCCDLNQNGSLSINELIQITNAFVGGCPGGPTPTPTSTPAPIACAGDCNGDREVAVAELIRMVAAALEPLAGDACNACPAATGTPDVTCLVAAVANALEGCPAAD